MLRRLGVEGNVLDAEEVVAGLDGRGDVEGEAGLVCLQVSL